MIQYMNEALEEAKHNHVRQAKGLFPCSTHCLGRFVVIIFGKQPEILKPGLNMWFQHKG